MDEKKFDSKKLNKLNNPARLLDIMPEFIWNTLDIQNKEGLVLVDIGAGTGFFSIPFLKYTGNGKVFACDISDTMIQWMEQHLSSEYPRIFPLKMDEAVVPLEDGVADIAYMINLHHELEAPVEILKESYRVLKNGGKIFIVDWKKEEIAEGPPVHLRVFPEQVENQLMSSGFKKVRFFDDMKKHFLLVAEKQ